MGKEWNIYRGFEEDSNEENSTLENFKNSNISYKIRKIDLMKSFDLPVPKTEYFKVGMREELLNGVKNRLVGSCGALIIRIACIPDKQSMPFFYLEKATDIDCVFEKIDDLLEQNTTITNFILQEAVPNKSESDKISGRIVFERNDVLPREQVLEIFKGARSTGILNNVNVNNKNYRRFEKNSGEFMKIASKIDEQSDIQENETREIFRFLNNHEENMMTVRDVIAKSKNIDSERMPLCFEFSYFRGSIVFTDFD